MNKFDVLNNLPLKAKLLLKTIYRNPGIPRVKLQRECGLKSGNYYDMIELLMDKQLIIFSNNSHKMGKGRPSELLFPNPEFAYFFSVLITRYNCELSISNFVGDTILMKKTELLKDTTVEQFKEYVSITFNEYINNDIIDYRSLLACTLVTGVPLNPKTYTFQKNYDDILWETFNVCAFLKELTSLSSVFVSTIANATNTGVFNDEYRKHTSSSLLVLLSNGTGLSVIRNNKLLPIKDFPPPSIEHWATSTAKRQCTCGKKGCLVTSIGTANIVNNVKHAMRLGEKSLLSPNQSFTLLDINDAAMKGDSLCLSILEEAVDSFYNAFCNLYAIFETNYLFLTGRLVEEAPLFAELTSEKLSLAFPNLNTVRITNYKTRTTKGITFIAVEKILG